MARGCFCSLGGVAVTVVGLGVECCRVVRRDVPAASAAAEERHVDEGLSGVTRDGEECCWAVRRDVPATSATSEGRHVGEGL